MELLVLKTDFSQLVLLIGRFQRNLFWIEKFTFFNLILIWTNLTSDNSMVDGVIADLEFQMQYGSWTWTISTTFLDFNLGLDWVQVVLMSLIFWSKVFLVFLVSLLVFGWMFSQYLQTAEVFVYGYGFRVFDIFSVIVQSYIEGCFSFSNILDFTKFAF